MPAKCAGRGPVWATRRKQRVPAACNGPVFSEIRHDQLHASEHRQQPSMPEKVALIGSGNWGSAIATKIGKNVLENDMFDKGAAPYS